MLYMDDAINATLKLMEAPSENLTVRSSYNLGGMSFTPKKNWQQKLKRNSRI